MNAGIAGGGREDAITRLHTSTSNIYIIKAGATRTLLSKDRKGEDIGIERLQAYEPEGF